MFIFICCCGAVSRIIFWWEELRTAALEIKCSNYFSQLQGCQWWRGQNNNFAIWTDSFAWYSKLFKMCMPNKLFSLFRIVALKMLWTKFSNYIGYLYLLSYVKMFWCDNTNFDFDFYHGQKKFELAISQNIPSYV